MELDERQILSIVDEELKQSSGGNENDFIDSDRRAALGAYLGQPDGREQEGRSSVVSTDVADAIEWIMPEIVKAFTQNDEVVVFDPTYEGDEEQAELESSYVYDTLMKENNGFLIVHQFVKDALLQKNGFIKCFYEKNNEIHSESYTGLTEIEYNLVISDESVEVVQETSNIVEGIPLYDIKVNRTTVVGKETILCVPPEEFRVNKMHNQVDLSTARFTAHIMLKSAGELVKEGYDKTFIDNIPTAQVYEDDREYRFYMQGETVYPDRDISSDPSLRMLEIAECYMHMDVDQDGVAELVKVTVAGGDNPTQVLDIESIDRIPFISATAILMSHKLFGLSLYDRLIQIQEQKTTLLRNILDNTYLQNNQRTVVTPGANIDDLLVSRPGGIVRANRPDAVQPIATPQLSSDAYRMMDYLDSIRTARAGVSPESTVQDVNVGDRVGSQGVERLLSQKEELVGLMIRVIAETGIKPLCYMIRDDLMKHQDTALPYKFRGQWVTVSPTKWRKRTNTTVRVGTGSGNRREQKETLGYLIERQIQLLDKPGQSLVRAEEVYNSLNDLAKVSGFASAKPYFLDPVSPEGRHHKSQVDQSMSQQSMMEQEMNRIQSEATEKIANAEVMKSQAQLINIELKSTNEKLKLALDSHKITSEETIDRLKQQLEEVKTALDKVNEDANLNFKYYEVDKRSDTQVKVARINKQESPNERSDEDKVGDGGL